MHADRLQEKLDRYYAYGGDAFVRYTHRLRVEYIGDLLAGSGASDGSAPRRALDAGTGYGIHAILLAEAGYQVTAVDIDAVELSAASQWIQSETLEDRVAVRREDLENLPREWDGAYDLVICSEVLEHLSDAARGARNLHRVLKPGGTAIVSMPNMASALGVLQIVYRWSGARWLLRRRPLTQHQVEHSRWWFGNIRRLLTEAGFTIDSMTSLVHVPLLWVLDRRLAPGSCLCARLDGRIGRIPSLRTFGYDLVVVARKT